MMRQQTNEARSLHGLELGALDALTAVQLNERVHRLARAGHADHAIAAVTGFGVVDVRRLLAQQAPR
jgi:hypothetical protein